MKYKRQLLLILLFLSVFFLTYLNYISIKNIKTNEEKLKKSVVVKSSQFNTFGYADMFKVVSELKGVRISSINAELASNDLICVEADYSDDLNKFDTLLKEIAKLENVAYIRDINIYTDGEEKYFKMKLFFVNNK